MTLAVHEAPMTWLKTAVLTRIRDHSIVPMLLTPVIAGAILTALAPLGTHMFALPGRALYWIGLCVAGGLGASAVQMGLSKWRPDLTGWQLNLALSVGATLAVTPFVFALSRSGSVTGIMTTLFYIWLIAIVITTVADLAEARRNKDTDDMPALMERLPVGLRQSDLYAVSSEDHYVRIHTSAGSHMLLMRLSDIPDLASPLAGLSPHRSWWVAEQGVDKVERSSGKFTIILKDGTRIPVSRSGGQRIREAGWIG